MKALSLTRPWAWAMFHGKGIENRDWIFKHRGRIIIHAAKSWDPDGFLFLASHTALLDDHLPAQGDFVAGALIGELDIVDMVTRSPSPWFFGRYGYLTTNAKEYAKPIPYRGQPGLFDIPDEIVRSGKKK